MNDVISQRLGRVELEPLQPIVAGSAGQWTLVYTVGSYGVDSGGTIKLAWPLVSDWEAPQFDWPAQSGYTTVHTNGRAKLHTYYHAKSHRRPWTPCLVIDVYDGSLAPGSQVTIVLGDQSHGGPGIRAQSYQESGFEFRLLVDPTNAALPRRLPTSPVVPVVAGDPVELVCILPTQAAVDTAVAIFVKGQDAWGNPTPAPAGLEFSWVGEVEVTFHERGLTAHGEGNGHVQVQSTAALPLCRSNPITFHTTEPDHKRYWGDLHGQTKATVGTGSEDEYFTFGRDVARLDFMSHQGNDFQITDTFWHHLNETTSLYNQDGRFVVFPGYEWSGNTPAGGDWNVFYRSEGQPIMRSSHWQVPDVAEDERTPAHPADVMFEHMHRFVGQDNVILAAHVGGRYADIRHFFDPNLVRLVEVVSDWGVFEWILWDAFDKGYIVGVMCNSDGHRCRPGAEGPAASQFGIRNGLTCVLARELTREAVFAALKARRCYGTSGPRIFLAFDMHEQHSGASYHMGSVVTGRGPLAVQARVLGTAPLEALMLYRGKEPVQTVRSPVFDDLSASNRIRVSWQGSRTRERGRRVVWDGLIRVQGTQVISAETVAFDAVTEGITAQTAESVGFTSSTTGDMDGIDLRLEQTGSGRVIFESQAGQCQVDLSELARQQMFEFGGLDMRVSIERYPEHLADDSLTLTSTVIPVSGKTVPYFVKAMQSDGHAAWSSPIYVQAR